VAEDEEIPIDTWQTNYRIRKARDRGGIPLTKGVMDDKDGAAGDRRVFWTTGDQKPDVFGMA
jgi:hypothetical protein